jgi:exosortase/archaeosortase family protein
LPDILLLEMDKNSLTARYLIYYIAVLLFFYELFMILPSTWIELLTARISSGALNFLGISSNYGVKADGVWMTLEEGVRYVQVYIIRECTAFHVWGIIIGLIVPLRRPNLRRKLMAVTFGASLVFFINLTRVMLTVYLAGYNAPPFSWFFKNPTVDTYHYPISFAYGVVGVAVVIYLINALILPELGDFLVQIPNSISRIRKNE